MALDIIKEIQEEAKSVIAAILGASWNQLDYEYNIFQNHERGYEKRYGFIPLNASFVEGASLGFTTMDHTFQLILTNTFINKDDDQAQNTALHDLYCEAHNILKDLQKKRLVLPNPAYQVRLISGLVFEDPEFLLENEVIVFRANFNIRYTFRNN